MALDTFTKFVNSPGGVLTAGAVLAGLVWKFFERVEAVLTENTKLEVAVWLLGVKPLGPKIEPWPTTFTKLFYNVFGRHLFSSKSILASVIATTCMLILLIPLLGPPSPGANIFKHFIALFPLLLATNIVPDFISIGASRLFLSLLIRKATLQRTVIIFIGSLLVALLMSIVALGIVDRITQATNYADYYANVVYGQSFTKMQQDADSKHGLFYNYYSEDASFAIGEMTDALFVGIWITTVFASLPASIWLWLYAGSGFLLKAARRFDIGFDWFNRKFDLEEHPLQSIGFVAGAIVAVVYWTAVAISRLM